MLVRGGLLPLSAALRSSAFGSAASGAAVSACAAAAVGVLRYVFVEAARDSEVRLRVARAVRMAASLLLAVRVVGRERRVRVAAVVRGVGLVVGAAGVSVRVAVGALLSVCLGVALAVRLAVALPAVVLVVVFAGLAAFVVDEQLELVVRPLALDAVALVVMSHERN